MAQTIIGLDIGTWSVKAAVLESSLRRYELRGCAEHHMPRAADGQTVEGEMMAAVRATLAELGDFDSVGTAAPGHRVLTRVMELPFSDAKRIQSVLGFQLDGVLPVPIEELIYDYHVLRETDEGSTLLCSAIRRTWIESFIEDLQAAGADPKSISLDTLVYASLSEPLAITDPERSTAIVDIGHMTTSISILHGGDVKDVRSIPRGGHHLTLALMRARDLEYAQAEQLKHRAVRLDGFEPPEIDAEVHQANVDIVQAALTPLLRDIRVSVHAWQQRSRRLLDEVLVCGGSTRMPGMVEQVSQTLGVSARRPKLSTLPFNTTEDDTLSDVVMPKAVGLALRHRETAQDRNLDFRRGELAYESNFKAIRDRAGFLFLAAAMIMGAIFGRQMFKMSQMEDQHAALVAQLEDYSERILGERKDDFDYVLSRVSRPPSGDAERVFPEMTAFRAFYAITAAQEVVNQNGAAGASAAAPAEATPEGAEGEKGTTGDETPKARGGTSPAPNQPPSMDNLRPAVRPPASEKKQVYKLKPVPPPQKAPGPDEKAPPAPSGDDKVSVQVELQQVQIDMKGAFIKGEANNIEAVEAFTTELRKVTCFPQVETSDTTRISFGERQDWLRFQLKLEILCEAPESEKAKSDPADSGDKDDADEKAKEEK